ncbi:ATP-dependent DNA ligase [Haloferax mediterranei ATCC 33500]|uniref:DNA ligase n=1 Tax=Haloferax mediterranei (strain ATCC 33500 / DSM 1411 / JCM 8866 / NBRC 14739 / NCIMB 2177 / R-4) TaxID=523841 RepID=I3R521_HALMT|nr:ATP-dependent DNA ligase LigA [Haloferax mediterranei]AFK19331.1 DNA ligase (ATP) [Haloferax mediterranei ATCC 33500]AHZ21313.1 DNA ligase [Haloferax mediterranei ATCC 33500]EMA04478.1 DNA ligase (ATP) [Haloferax mediterranei ATCC 33500]MDX5989436.1 ATP-dependent DNA ligase LigA [Haloferax mediterranei ATCC 33500]QCQ75800.1 ATP-dependent DNA ligase [Haloferax mediterranei ATCC 33500]
MEFAEFAARAAEIEAESADLAVVSLLSDLFRDADDDLSTVARFVQGRVFPAWDSTTLDIGPRLCHEAIARAAGPNVSADDVEDRLADRGEIGAVAASYDFGGQRGLAAFGAGGQDGLTVAEVDSELRALAAASGSGSEETKLKTLYGLFNRTDPDEARFLARLVLSEMRIGVGEGTVRDAIAEAFLVAPEDAAAIRDDDVDTETETAARERRDEAIATVARALQVSNDYGMVAEVTRDEGESGLSEVRLEVGRPVQAMLAQAGTAADALDEWETAAVETKFDGARVQVHRDEAGDVSLFSRNMEDVTNALPEIVEFVEDAVDEPAILDGEVVAMDDDGEPLPFQEILRRFRRKHDVGRMREEVRVELRAFDCLHAAGDDLLTEPLTTRHDRLATVLGPDSDAVSDLLLSDCPDEVAAYESEALEAGHEGIMLKNPDAAYSPGDRGKNWLKRKPDVETLDLVVTGAEWGEGRRAKFLGTFLLSARVDDESGDDEFETIGKVATGITDEELVELTELLEPEIERESGKEVDIRPSVVFEVGYEEIQASPTYSSGYALRFPRFISVREDKTAETADSLERIERLAESQ